VTSSWSLPGNVIPTRDIVMVTAWLCDTYLRHCHLLEELQREQQLKRTQALVAG